MKSKFSIVKLKIIKYLNLSSVWAPEIHFINNRWYIYFAADNGDNKNHKMYVLESETQDAQGKYKFMGQLKTDGWAMYLSIVY